MVRLGGNPLDPVSLSRLAVHSLDDLVISDIGISEWPQQLGLFFICCVLTLGLALLPSLMFLDIAKNDLVTFDLDLLSHLLI